MTASRNNRDNRGNNRPNPPGNRRHRFGISRSLDVSVSCDDSVGSNSPPGGASAQTLLYSQHSADDFPHGHFDFSHNHDVQRSPRQHQHVQQQVRRFQWIILVWRYFSNERVDLILLYSFFLLSQQTFSKQQPLQYYQGQTVHRVAVEKPHAQNYHGVETKFSAHTSKTHHTPAGSGSGSGSAGNGKLPHGLTVQELKEMTRARLAAEHNTGSVVSADSGKPDMRSLKYSPPGNHNQTISQDVGTDYFTRQRVFSADSFGSTEHRHRLGSAESFGSAQLLHSNSGYHQRSIGQSFSNEGFEQPSLSVNSFDNESYKSAVGSDSVFGSESHGSKATKQSGNSFYQPSFTPSSKFAGMSPKVQSNRLYDDWNEIPNRPSSPSSIPTVAHSSDNEISSFFSSALPVRKLVREVSAGGVLPNSVAESVLSTFDDSFDKNEKSDLHFADSTVSYDLASPLKTDNFSWSGNTKMSSQTGDNGDHVGMSQFQSEWNNFLNIKSADDNKDDFPLSTFASKPSLRQFGEYDSSPHNHDHVYSSPFQTVPEEQVIHNLVSLDVNIPESFLDDHAQIESKAVSKLRRKKSKKTP